MKQLLLRELRKEKNWSLDYVAQKIGVSNQAISRIELGKSKPSFEVLLKILELFEEEQLLSKISTIFGAGTQSIENEGK